MLTCGLVVPDETVRLGLPEVRRALVAVGANEPLAVAMTNLIVQNAPEWGWEAGRRQQDEPMVEVSPERRYPSGCGSWDAGPGPRRDLD